MNTVQNKSVNSSSGVGAPGGGKWAFRLKVLLFMMFIMAAIRPHGRQGTGCRDQ